MADPALIWRSTIKRRVIVAAVVFTSWTAAIEARLFYLQVISHAELMSRAERQQQRTITSPAKRGDIYDRHGRLLAYSVDTDTIYAVPYEIKDVRRTADALCRALDDCSRRDVPALIERLSQKRPFAYVKRRVTPTEARRVATLDLEGIGFVGESRRFYPNRELGAHVLGYVGTDNIGLGGIEAAYDKVIRGREGTLLVQTDAKRKAFSRVERTPTGGGALELTIDEQLQYIVERELRAGVEEKRADGGSAVLMDPHTGEVLAMASYPTFNPNVYNAFSEVARRNRAVQDLYEPGSTFKVVTVAAALEENVLPLESYIDTNPGVIRFGSRVIDEYGGRNHGVLSLTNVIVKSSNVGAIKIGLRVGPERLGVYINRFGFGRAISSDFPGENRGIVWSPDKLNDSALASVSMGYQVAVTPLQMVAAISAVANGGVWNEPRVVRAMVKDGVRTPAAARTSRRAIGPETVAKLLPILEAVVEEGTAKKAKLASYTVAGKTGTADKLINGRYSGVHQNVSFVGFAPSRRPVLAAIVMVDTPRVGSDTGGEVAAPIFQRIADAALRHLGVPPTLNPGPPVVVARAGKKTPVTPASGPVLGPRIVQLEPGVSEDGLMPDLRLLSTRAAIRALSKLGLTARLKGSGVVLDQTPRPGEPLERGSVVTLTLGRELPRSLATSGALP